MDNLEFITTIDSLYPAVSNQDSQNSESQKAQDQQDFDELCNWNTNVIVFNTDSQAKLPDSNTFEYLFNPDTYPAMLDILNRRFRVSKNPELASPTVTFDGGEEQRKRQSIRDQISAVTTYINDFYKENSVAELLELEQQASSEIEGFEPVFPEGNSEEISFYINMENALEFTDMLLEELSDDVYSDFIDDEDSSDTSSQSYSNSEENAILLSDD